MDYPDLLREICQEIKPQESPDDPDDVTENYHSSFALGKLDAVLGVAPRRDYQGYKRGYVLGILDKLNIQEKDRDFRSEF
jgi:ethanolamine ammonia-lyase large subunit